MTNNTLFLPHFKPFLIIFLAVYSLSFGQEPTAKDNVNTVLDAWHDAAARADYEVYFGLMTTDAIFIGTDAEENWQNMEFRAYAKPYFDRGKAWSFIPLERNIYFSESQNIAWFDELLDTQMGICRGSGVLTMRNGKWKIKHYVLSITVPNEDVEKLDSIKTEHDMKLIEKLKG
ncbi:MAG TPA: hypothetical protein ENH91_15390 [Leeuwenhoekiella sp.]|nr:hypothetical protein [Leeuwenhoekiella sp.]